MRASMKRRVGRRSSGRTSCAWQAGVALLVLVLLVCPGCDDSIRETFRQGALGIYDDAMDSLFSEIGTELNSEIQNLGGSGSTGTTTTSDGGG